MVTLGEASLPSGFFQEAGALDKPSSKRHVPASCKWSAGVEGTPQRHAQKSQEESPLKVGNNGNSLALEVLQTLNTASLHQRALE